MAMQQTFPTKGPLAAFGMVMLLSLTACGKVTEPQSYQLPPAKQIAETGSISGRVTLIGGIPADLNQAIDVGGNPFCSNHAGLTNPTWRLSKDGGLADVVVSLKLADRAANLAVPAPLIDQSHCEFVPHLTVLQAGQSVKLRNSDLTFHNIRVVKHRLGTLNEGLNLANLAQPARGDENEYQFNEPGIYRLECDVHRWMRAWVYVNEGIYATATNHVGNFEITRILPDAEYELTAWHPMFAEPLKQTITVKNGKTVVNFDFKFPASFQRS